MNMMISYQELVRTFPRNSSTLPKLGVDKLQPLRFVCALIFNMNLTLKARFHANIFTTQLVLSRRIKFNNKNKVDLQ